MPKIRVRVIDCWVFQRSGGSLRFLIMKRSSGRMYDGIWHCVHGKIREGEPAWQAARRELKEETGLIPVSMWTADTMSSFYEADSDRVNLVPVFAVEVEEGSCPVLSEEHSEYQWLDSDRASDMTAWKNHAEAIRTIDKMMREDFPQKKWLEIDFD